MDESELISVLRETGIVSKENDANGVRIILTINDNETLKSKSDKSELNLKLKNTQFWAILITSVCLMLTTLFATLSNFSDTTEYIPRPGYIHKLTNGGKESCFIPEVPKKQADRLQQLTGIKPCA